MTKINYICDCGNSNTAEVGQSFEGGILRWYLSFKCLNCNKATEIDGIDDIPLEFREEILKQEGVWGLEVKDDKKSL